MPDFQPIYLFHREQREGKCFRTQKQFDARGDGWEDSPDKLDGPENPYLNNVKAPEGAVPIRPEERRNYADSLVPAPTEDRPYEHEAYEPDMLPELAADDTEVDRDVHTMPPDVFPGHKGDKKKKHK